MDLFAPPTKEELASASASAKPDLFAPPTKDELASVSGSQVPWYQVENPKARGWVKGALNSLPVAGGLIGGAAATPETFGIGTIPGAAAGAAAGKSLQTVGEKYLLGEEPTREKVYLDPLKEGAQMATAEAGGQVLGKGAELAAQSKLGQKAIGLLGTAGAKTGEALTGVSEKEIKTYAKNADQIKAMAKSSDNNVAEAADQIRAKYAEQLNETRAQMNNQIQSALEGSEKTVPAKDIVSALEKEKAKIDPDLYPDALKEIDGLKSKISKLTDDSGNIPIQRANSLKQFLQDEASTAYRAPGQGTIGTKAANAAKGGAAKARMLINEAEPSIATANEKLASLHDIEDDMNMNLIREGKPEAGLLAAGSGGNIRNANNLKKLGLLTGSDMTTPAENLSAMRTFGSPKLMSVDTTGKGAQRLGVAALAGYAIGHLPGAALASALTSPAALRAAIDAGQISADALKDPNIQRMIGRGLLGKANGK